MIYIGFVRPTQRHTRARQQFQLREYDLYDLVENKLDDAIQMMRPGRALLVPEVSVLGRSGGQIVDTIARVHERGGYVVDATTKHESRTAAGAAAMGASTRNRSKLTSEQAKQMATKWTDRQLEMARRMWKKPDLNSAEIAEKTGIPLPTLNRRLGPRGIKKPGPQAKKKR